MNTKLPNSFMRKRLKKKSSLKTPNHHILLSPSSIFVLYLWSYKFVGPLWEKETAEIRWVERDEKANVQGTIKEANVVGVCQIEQM